MVGVGGHGASDVLEHDDRNPEERILELKYRKHTERMDDRNNKGKRV